VIDKWIFVRLGGGRLQTATSSGKSASADEINP
jgi:hypothetical protein